MSVKVTSFYVILLKPTATILAAAMFVGDRTTASTLLAGASAVGKRQSSGPEVHGRGHLGF